MFKPHIFDVASLQHSQLLYICVVSCACVCIRLGRYLTRVLFVRSRGYKYQDMCWPKKSNAHERTYPCVHQPPSQLLLSKPQCATCWTIAYPLSWDDETGKSLPNGWIHLDYNDYNDYLQAIRHGNDNYFVKMRYFHREIIYEWMIFNVFDHRRVTITSYPFFVFFVSQLYIIVIFGYGSKLGTSIIGWLILN